MSAYRKFNIDGFVVSLFAHDVCDMLEKGIALRIDGEHADNYIVSKSTSVCEDLARKLLNEFFNN